MPLLVRPTRGTRPQLRREVAVMATPRLTVKAVNDKMETTKERLSALEELVNRSSARDAHPELGRKVGQMHRDLVALGSRLNSEGFILTETNLLAIMAEIERVEGRANDAYLRLDALEGWRREIVDPKLAEHDEALLILKSRVTHVADQVSGAASAAASAVAIANSARAEANRRFNWFAAIPVALVASLFAWWWAAQDWVITEEVYRANGTVLASVAIQTWPNADFAFWLVVLAGALLALAAGYVFALRGHTSEPAPAPVAVASAAAASTHPSAPVATPVVTPAPVQEPARAQRPAVLSATT